MVLETSMSMNSIKPFVILFLSVVLTFNSYGKRFTVEFTNTQSNVCAVYLDNSFIGKIEKGAVFITKLTEGVNHLSFIVFDSTGSYSTYDKDLEIKESNHFLLLKDDNGSIQLKEYQDAKTLNVLKTTDHLPLLSADNFNLIQLKLKNFEFENSRFELIKKEVTKNRLTTVQLLKWMVFIQPQSMKSEIARIAYPHLIDQENYSNILSELNKTTVEKLTQDAAIVNQYL